MVQGYLKENNIVFRMVRVKRDYFMQTLTRLGYFNNFTKFVANFDYFESFLTFGPGGVKSGHTYFVLKQKPCLEIVHMILF